MPQKHFPILFRHAVLSSKNNENIIQPQAGEADVILKKPFDLYFNNKRLKLTESIDH